MKLSLQLLLEGDRHTICALTKGSRCEAVDFLDACAKSNPAGFAMLFALLERIADYGPPRNPEQFKNVGNGIYEIKAIGARLFCFYDEASHAVIILTHGWKKGPPREQNQQIKRALSLKEAYLSQYQ